MNNSFHAITPFNTFCNYNLIDQRKQSILHGRANIRVQITSELKKLEKRANGKNNVCTKQ